MFISYGALFFITIAICMFLLVVTAMIPKTAIQSHCEESAEFFEQQVLFPRIKIQKANTTIDYYSDCILLNIIYCMDNKHPFSSAISAQYYSKNTVDINHSFMEVVRYQREGNMDYSRYWHGSIVFLRPLLCLTNIQGIYKCLTIIFGILFVIVEYILLRKKQWWMIIIYPLALCSVQLWIVVRCVEYINMFMWMEIMVICYLLLERRGNRTIYCLSIVNGVVTCFLDFLTTETIAITVPLFMLCVLRRSRQEKSDGKKEVKFVITSLGIWGCSYGGMIVIKWLLSWGILGNKVLNNTFQRIGERVSGNPLEAIGRNICVMFSAGENVVMVMALGYAIAVIWFIGYAVLYSRKNNNWTLMSNMLLLLVPYLRYVILSNHAKIHYFFTYRSQLIVILIMSCSICNAINKKLQR